ncbi:MCT family MFS transporter [Ascoidea rubescens DSM 1968]|uniref:MFS general substrate transporter n=1 Tax=Ascoidea rubescens DSM 1968 TaxID=1344418 RepID=A0A1D2VA53_9ASCO|nr:MFS general substrate transporter [Ascoidea rubescens DSM 1968]ODV58303.1 MFS general substrate transporter [Ascoidea rubescens DSM 1968]
MSNSIYSIHTINGNTHINDSSKKNNSNEIQYQLDEADNNVNHIDNNLEASKENLLKGIDGDSIEFPDGGFRAWLVVFGSFLGLCTSFGLFNASGAVQSYVQYHQLKDYNVSTISWIFSIYSFITFSFSVFSGLLFDKRGSNLPMIIGAIFMSGSYFCLANCEKYYQFLITFGILNGIGTSFCFTASISVVSHWFSVKRAFAMSIATIGGSVGGGVFPLILREMYPKIGFSWSMRTIGFIVLGTQFVSAALIKDRLPRKPKTMVIMNNNNSNNNNNNSENKSFQFNYFKELTYSLFVAALLFIELYVFIVLSYLASYAMAKGFSDSQGLLLLTITNLSGIPGRVILGYLADKYGRFNVICFVTFMSCLTVWVMWLPFGSNLTCLYLFSALWGFFSGSILCLSPACCGQISKTENFGKRYGTAYCVASFGSLVGLPIGGAIIGKSASSQGYTNEVIFAGLIGTVCLLFLCLSRYSIAGHRLVKV